ncbi:helix-turn-helix transcriptional regulator [Deinococcus sp. 6YEL10]|uniref:helix-turn-helix domain-containing protein n=1 Tax=Deinococcus sp. 6YEL10 TaxID=2745870 RepID=UPI001E2FCBCB|nr:helix-turn-helix transcriptional regulator [Deinococcus sp. 6YEL10]MCD0160003.1 helix-turn-helix transcriptional regulator [Deinococcus sp. 6YEL10]
MARRRTESHQDGNETAELMPAPVVTEQALSRGLKLQQWLDRRGLRQADLARMSGLTEMTISKYISGKTDIGSMRSASITKLLDGMFVSDAWAWTYFEIPVEARSSWRSLRQGKMGPPEQGALETFLADLPVQGSGWMIPAQSMLTVDPADKSGGLQIGQFGGAYWIAKKEEQPAGAVLLGRFVSSGPPA